MGRWVTYALDLLGVGLVVTGVALVSAPLALIAAGGAVLGVSWRASQ